MSEYRFYAYSDVEYRNQSTSILKLPIELYTSSTPEPTTETEIRVPTELNIPYTVFEILVACIAIVGNLMVIIVFQRDKKLRRRTNYYIVSLAFADFLVGLLGVPFAILASIGLPKNLHACLFTVSLLVVLCTISIFCLVAVSVDRYWAILYPMAYSRNVRTKTAIGIISMCWFAGTIVGFLPLFGWHSNVNASQACLFVEVMDYNYLVFLYFATIIIPALLLLGFYAHIYRVIIRQVRQMVTMNPIGDSSRKSSVVQIAPSSTRSHNGTMLRVLGATQKKDVKATQNLSIIVLFFMICWIPLYTINCIKAFCPDCYIHPKLTFLSIILSHLNSAVNPVLYAYHLKDFRAALKNLIFKTLGVEINPPPEPGKRGSLASQPRLKTAIDKRPSLQKKIYINSPVWLQQQEKLKRESSTRSTVSSSLASVHQTVAAVASTGSGHRQNVWQIPQVSSIMEDCEQGIDGISIDKSNSDNESNRSISNHICYPSKDNKSYCSSAIDLHADVFIKSTDPSPNDPSSTDISPTQLAGSCIVYIQNEIRTDEDRFDRYNRHLAITEMENSVECFNIDRLNTKIQTGSETSLQSTTFLNIEDVDENIKMNDLTTDNNSAVFVIDNDTNPLSPERKSWIKKTNGIPSGWFGKVDTKMTRSHSCTNGSELVEIHSEKMSPLKMVSNMIFPPVKHSSLFHIFESCKSPDVGKERKRRTSEN